MYLRTDSLGKSEIMDGEPDPEEVEAQAAFDEAHNPPSPEVWAQMKPLKDELRMLQSKPRTKEGYLRSAQINRQLAAFMKHKANIDAYIETAERLEAIAARKFPG